MVKFILFALILLFYSCNSIESKRHILLKYEWKCSSDEFLGYDILVFDTIKSDDTGYFVVSPDMVLTKNNRLIGRVIAVSNREVTIKKPDNKEVTYVSFADR